MARKLRKDLRYLRRSSLARPELPIPAYLRKMKLLPLLAFLLLAPLPYGQEKPPADKGILNVEKLVASDQGEKAEGDSDEPQKLLIGTERIHFFEILRVDLISFHHIYLLTRAF